MRKAPIYASIIALIALRASILVASDSPGAVKRVSILNMANVDSAILERVRGFAEKNLYVPVTVTNSALSSEADLVAAGESAARMRTSLDACLVVLVLPTKKSDLHALILTNLMVTVVNIGAIKSDDPERFVKRVEQQVMRGVAFLFGIGPDPDPHCVMHDYHTLDELDNIGLNFSPPWGDMFRKAAAQRGLPVRPLFPHRPKRAPAAVPPPPPAPPVPPAK